MILLALLLTVSLSFGQLLDFGIISEATAQSINMAGDSVLMDTVIYAKTNGEIICWMPAMRIVNPATDKQMLVIYWDEGSLRKFVALLGILKQDYERSAKETDQISLTIQQRIEQLRTNLQEQKK